MTTEQKLFFVPNCILYYEYVYTREHEHSDSGVSCKYQTRSNRKVYRQIIDYFRQELYKDVGLETSTFTRISL